MAQMEQRDSFKSRVGFILSCVGSAVGIGAIWLFPIVSENSAELFF